jgi:Rieske Fe-S protein
MLLSYAACDAEDESTEEVEIMKPNFCKERRELLKSTCALAGATALVSVGGSLNAFAAGGSPEPDEPKDAPKKGDGFVFSDGPNKGTDVSLTDIVVDAAPITVQAKDPATGKVREYEGDSDHATVLLYRVAPGKIPDEMKADTVDGVMAYSAMCTHQGCMLSTWDKKTKLFLCEWDAASKQFRCPCHFALFDPLKGGENTGGAATRKLPRIPLKAVDGKLVVAYWIRGWVGVQRG